ncbi:Cyclin-H [Dactylella cylindrospora]|nr:Cyclin-H [Dactylella cylindrospora]
MTEDHIYASTTQCKTWSFGPSTLNTIRQNTNAAGIRTIKRGWKRARLEAASNGTTSTTASTPSATTPIPSSTPTPTPTPSNKEPIDPATVPDPDPLTPSEELTLLHYYILKLIDMSDIFSFPSNVKSTACVFLSRFHLHHSIQSYHPKVLIPTILFLATKTENHYIPLSDFCKRVPRLTPEAVLKHEFTVAGGVGWDLDVRHPLRAAEGGIMELLTALPPTNNSNDPGLQVLRDKLAPNPTLRVREAHGRMKTYLTKEALVSDVYYHYTPPQIFLGALWLADKDLAEGYIEWRFGEGATMGRATKRRKKEGKRIKKEDKVGEDDGAKEEPQKSNVSPLSLKLLPVVKACAEMMSRAKEFEKTPPEELKRIDKKLYHCQNPQKFLGAGSAIGNGGNGSKKPIYNPENDAPGEKRRKLEDDGFGAPLTGKD